MAAITQRPTPDDPNTASGSTPNVAPAPADAALLRECADGYEMAAAILHDAGAVATMHTRANRLRALAAEQEKINVGLLRVHVCKVTHRLSEWLSAADAANVFGMDERDPATDMADAMRALLDVARLRVTRDDETGVLSFHDLLVTP